jgi:hypothetical protein
VELRNVDCPQNTVQGSQRVVYCAVLSYYIAALDCGWLMIAGNYDSGSRP